MPIVIDDDPRIEQAAKSWGFASSQDLVEACVRVIVADEADNGAAIRSFDRGQKIAAWERVRSMAEPLTENVDYRRESFYPDAVR